MNIYALLSVCASTICVSLGASVFFLNRKSALNKVFALLMLANAYWAFTEYMLRISTSFAMASLWEKAIAFWPLTIAVLLNFALLLTESDLLKRKIIYALLYVPPILFSLLGLTTNLIDGPPVLKYWGYTYTVPVNSLASRITGVWAAAIMLLALFLLVSYYNRVIEKRKKQQIKLITIGFGISVVVSLLTDYIFPVTGVNFPGLSSISGTIIAIFVVYAMFRFELFGFRPEVAAENVFASMLDAILLSDLEGKVLKVNRALLELSGFEEKEILGKTIEFIFKRINVRTKENLPANIMAELRNRRQVDNYELTFEAKSGQQKTCVLSCSIVSDGAGRDVGVAFVLHDFTKQKELEQKLLNTERLASIGELAGILGHDLRNPLNAIRVASYYLKTKHADTLDGKDSVMFESIERSIEYSDKIVNDLVEYASEMKLTPEAASVRSLISGALALAPPPLNIQVVDETLQAPMMVDVDRIHTAFANIIKNAYDAMPSGGVLTIKSQEAPGTMIFSFTDTGEGMTQETLGKIWKPLFTTKAKGMGFGLPNCKRIVEAHNGKIVAQSEPKKGTTIKIELPVSSR